MLFLLEAGYRIGKRYRRDASARGGLGVVDAAVFALSGLLLAFSGALSRLDARRQLIVQETNAIGTAFLRTRLPTLVLGLLPGLALLSSLLAGYAMAPEGRRSPLLAVVYAVSVALTIYAVLDLDTPRAGLIRLDAAEEHLRRLHDSIL